MIEPAQSIGVAAPAEPGAQSEFAQSAPYSEPIPPGPSKPAAIGGWRTLVGWVAGGVAAGFVIGWVVLFSGWQVGSKAEWLTAGGVVGAVVVALWQTLTIQRQATLDAAEAAERLRIELAAAAARSAEDLAHVRELHWTEMEAQRKLARAQRFHLLQQQQKQAVIEVSRAVGAHTHMLATLWNEAARILRIEDRDEREQAMNPVFEQIGQVVNDFSVELANAHLLIEDNRLHAALDRINQAVLMAIDVAEELHLAVAEGRAPQPNPISSVQRLMQQRAAEARHLAWDLLRAGLQPAPAARPR